VYPRKVGKKAARAAWKKLKPNAGLVDKILRAVEQQKGWQQWRQDEGRYIPNPATWLNQGRWDDQDTAQQSGPPAEIGRDGLTPQERILKKLERERENGV
jgi:hypothetical protein